MPNTWRKVRENSKMRYGLKGNETYIYFMSIKKDHWQFLINVKWSRDFLYSTSHRLFGGGAADAGTAAPSSASVCQRYRSRPH